MGCLVCAFPALVPVLALRCVGRVGAPPGDRALGTAGCARTSRAGLPPELGSFHPRLPTSFLPPALTFAFSPQKQDDASHTSVSISAGRRKLFLGCQRCVTAGSWLSFCSRQEICDGGLKHLSISLLKLRSGIKRDGQGQGYSVSLGIALLYVFSSVVKSQSVTCLRTVDRLFCKLAMPTCAFFWHIMKTSCPEDIGL